MRQRSLIILKPDSYQRKLIGTLLARIEQKGFKLAGMKLMFITKDLAEQHYAVHKGKHFYDDLISYITSGPVVVVAVEGESAISVMRKVVGATAGFDAQPGTIRGDFSISLRYNLIHASDSEESAERELKIFFNDDELIDEIPVIHSWIEGGE